VIRRIRNTTPIFTFYFSFNKSILFLKANIHWFFPLMMIFLPMRAYKSTGKIKGKINKMFKKIGKVLFSGKNVFITLLTFLLAFPHFIFFSTRKLILIFLLLVIISFNVFLYLFSELFLYILKYTYFWFLELISELIFRIIIRISFRIKISELFFRIKIRIKCQN